MPGQRKRKKTAVLLSFAILFAALTSSGAYYADTVTTTGLGVTLTASVEGRAQESIGAVLEESGLFLGGGSLGSKNLTNLSLTLSGAEFFRLLLELSGERAAFSLPLIDERRFELNPGVVAGTLHLQELVENLLEQNGISLEDASSPLYSNPFASIDFAELARRYVEIFAETFSEGVVVEETAYPMKVLDRREIGDLYTWEPEAEALADMLDAMAEEMETDRELDRAVSAIADYIRRMRGLLTVNGGDSNSMDAEEAAKALENGYASLPENLRYAAGQLRGGVLDGITLRFQMGMNSAHFAMVSLYAGNGADVQSSTEWYQIGYEDASREADTSWCIYYEDRNGLNDVRFRGNKTASAVVGQLVGEMNQQPFLQMVYQFASGKTTALGLPYGTLVLNTPAADVSLIVMDTPDGKYDHVLSLKNLDAMSGQDEVTAVTVHLTADPQAVIEVPQGPVEDLDGYSQEQLSELVSGFAEKIMGQLG